MLKKCYGLFLGLVVLAGSACVSPTHASSASIVITNIRAGSQASAAEEGVVIYNNSSFEVDITNWCLTNKSAVKFACFTPFSQYEASIVPPYSYVTVASIKSIKGDNQSNYSVVYEPSNASSGSIVASADTISLIDADSQLVDQYAWSSNISSSQQWARAKLSMLPDIFVDTNATIDWQKTLFTDFPITQLEYREVPHEQPSDEPEDESPVQTEVVPEKLSPIITELLPNAIGSDEGGEFIELYNPNQNDDITLAGYRLLVGPAFEKSYMLPSFLLKAGEYKVFSNSELGYSLLNSSSRVALKSSSGLTVSEVPAYSSPADGEAWALIDDVWQYTNVPTPGADNLPSVVNIVQQPEAVTVASSLKPCAANQYRSPETNRCRLMSSSSSTPPVACKAGQERNPETNRCRTIATTTSSACKEGQERNLDTNRCRNVKQLSTADFAVKGATTQQQGGMGWYIWAVIGGIVLLILGYAVWEWRDELARLIKIVKGKFAGKTN